MKAFYNISDTEFNTDSVQDDINLLLLEIDGYEGPLDVLLELAKNQKIDITKISILELVNQYLDFIKRAKMLDLELAAEYLVMASWLAYIKSNLLIPKEEDGEGESQDEISDLLAFNLKRLKAMRDTSDELFKRDD